MTDSFFTAEQELAIRKVQEGFSKLYEADIIAKGVPVELVAGPAEELLKLFPELQTKVQEWVNPEEDILDSDPRFVFEQTQKELLFYTIAESLSLPHVKTLNQFNYYNERLGRDLSDLTSYCTSWDWEHGVWKD